mmetsp:Transcript_13414/g.38077  ORF Transcript_13414/g.38077 Transcript_13414/m.38077 type:complete len:110 (+) Transcript_13414:124-453(+)
MLCHAPGPCKPSIMVYMVRTAKLAGLGHLGLLPSLLPHAFHASLLLTLPSACSTPGRFCRPRLEPGGRSLCLRQDTGARGTLSVPELARIDDDVLDVLPPGAATSRAEV